MLSSRSMRLVQSAIEKIAVRLGARVAEGIAERVIFRSLFPMGLTVFDPLDEELLGGLSEQLEALEKGMVRRRSANRRR